MRMSSPIESTKTLPSPMEPVLAAWQITETTLSASPSGTTTSTFTLGRKSIVYSEPREISVWPFWRPKPRTSVTVMPTTPSSFSASLTSSSLKGLITASIFFIPASVTLAAAARLERLAVEGSVLPCRGVPGEVLGHRVLDQRLPDRGLPVDRGGPPHRGQEGLRAEVVEHEAGPGAPGRIELHHRVGEPARPPHHRCP